MTCHLFVASHHLNQCWLNDNSSVSQLFSSSSEQPEQSILACKPEQPTVSCIAIFHKYCCNIKHKILAGMLLICKNTTMQVYVAWISTYYVLCTKAYDTLGVCSGLPLVHDKLLGVPAFVRATYWLFRNKIQWNSNQSTCLRDNVLRHIICKVTITISPWK